MAASEQLQKLRAGCNSCRSRIQNANLYLEPFPGYCHSCWVSICEQEDREDVWEEPDMAEPEYDSCEDCMGSGGHRDSYGEGNCGACSGTGHRPSNEAAYEEVRQRQEARNESFYESARRAMDEDWGLFD